MRLPRCSVNQMAPSGPSIGVCGPAPGLGTGYSVKRSVFGSNAAILFPACSEMYSRPSAAHAIPWGRELSVGSGHSVNRSVLGSNRPSWLAPISTKHNRAAGAATGAGGRAGGGDVVLDDRRTGDEPAHRSSDE